MSNQSPSIRIPSSSVYRIWYFIRSCNIERSVTYHFKMGSDSVRFLLPRYYADMKLLGENARCFVSEQILLVCSGLRLSYLIHQNFIVSNLVSGQFHIEWHKAS